MAGVVLLRIFPSSLTCCKNRNVCQTKTSTSCAGCICVIELFFYVFLLLSLVTLFLGSYWIFSEKPPTCSESVTESCCSSYVYVCSAIFNVLQYVVYFLGALYTLVTVACVRGMHNVMSAMGDWVLSHFLSLLLFLCLYDCVLFVYEVYLKLILHIDKYYLPPGVWATSQNQTIGLYPVTVNICSM